MYGRIRSLANSKVYHFLANLDISYLHVFTYSERSNTEAAVMGDVVDKIIRSKRSKMLRALSIKKRRSFYESQLGKNFTVLFEEKNKEDERNLKVKDYEKALDKFDDEDPETKYSEHQKELASLSNVQGDMNKIKEIDETKKTRRR